MFKHMLLGLGAALLLVVVTAMPVQAVHISIPPDPPAAHVLPGSVIVIRGAWEWVWVSPCDERDAKKCSFFDNVDTYGFAPPVITPSSNPWTESFPEGFGQGIAIGSDQILRGTAGDTGLISAFMKFDPVDSTKVIGTICASNFFSSDYPGECQEGDLNKSLVLGAPFSGGDPTNKDAEVLWVRDYVGYVPAVPEPSSLLLLGAGLLGLAAWRWKQRA